MQFNKDKNSVIKATQTLKLLVLDVDGVLTDGSLYFSNSGEELKVFNTLDGHGIKMLKKSGIEVGIITGRTSKIVEHRASNLGIDILYQGREDKLQALNELLNGMDITLAEVAYAGDDIPDLSAIENVGVGFSVPNGHQAVRSAAAVVTSNKGGAGAVREIADFILECNKN